MDPRPLIFCRSSATPPRFAEVAEGVGTMCICDLIVMGSQVCNGCADSVTCCVTLLPLRRVLVLSHTTLPESSS